MSVNFTVLASGSAGNAALLQADGFGLLLDCGLAARQIAHRLAMRGCSWRHVHAVVLTHTHRDHWSRSALKSLVTHRIVLYCHLEHISALAQCEYFEQLKTLGLVRQINNGEWLEVAKSVRILPHEVAHDCEPTFAFRCEGAGGLFGPNWSLGYAADLGHWDHRLVEFLANSDLLALEFNHDEHMQRTSGRPRFLIDRVLGPFGHLSNRQAAGLVSAILEASTQAPARGLITLHRSRECNTESLVDHHAQEALRSRSPLRLAHQHEPTETVELGAMRMARRVTPVRRAKRCETAGLFEQ